MSAFTCIKGFLMSTAATFVSTIVVFTFGNVVAAARTIFLDLKHCIKFRDRGFSMQLTTINVTLFLLT